MSSNRGSNNGGVGSIPAASRKMVMELKEIVNNTTEVEIYATLKDCHMDPNEAVNRLLSQDPFHEVKSKRDKKKETKDSTESRFRGGGNTSNRGTRSGTDRYGGRGGSTQFSSSDSGALHGKIGHRKENGMNHYTNSSSTAPGIASRGMFQRPPAPSDFVTNENKASTLSTGDANITASQPSTGYQSAWVGGHGQKSMADIVKMGRPQSKVTGIPASSQYSGKHHLAHAPPSAEGDQSSKVSDVYTEPGTAPDEWPLIEPPQASISVVYDSHADSQLHPDQSIMPSDEINQQTHVASDEAEVEEDSSVENHDHVGSSTVSSRNMQADNSGDASLFDNDMYKNMSSYQSHNHAFQSEEVEDIGASVPSEIANMHQLSIQEEDHEVAYEEDVPSVVIPNHLQVQSADCSHLSFGSFGAAPVTGYSDPFTSRSSRSNLEETLVETDAPVIEQPDTRNSEYYGDESIRAATDVNLVHRTTGGDAGFDSPSVPQADVLKQENSEVAHTSQYAFPSSSPQYTFENAQQLNAAFNYSQTSAQMQHLTPFSNSAASLPNTLLASNIHPVRESELPYSPFPMSQSMPTKYGNTVSSISGSSISVAEALKGFQSVQSSQQNPSGTSNVATGPALPQHLVHPYSQPTLPLGPFANMISYPFLPQSYTYMPSGYQQMLAGNNTYPQSLAAVLPQYKSSVSVSNLPQSAAVPSGYGAFGSSTTIPANYGMNPSAASPGGSTMGYDDVLSSQYKDNSHLISLQQNDNSAMWLHGPGSRTISAVPASTYYSFQGQQGQQPGGFQQGQQPSQNYGNLGYPNFYHSQTGISLEHQQQNPRDGAHSGSQGQPKQSQQIWQNSY
ncbi:COPII coat assembly protein like [Heracleum sosnowskyi]|uniref:COPII coat assembly protein like n=1 Tax=Heracleum sosnowskyi TaxID=360622 RepID=A0AAD8MDF8_9APIA|nr:COPII coat assembly protein like [Heracleum sosnowskyi]